MHVFRGRAPTPAANRAVLDDVFRRAADEREPVVWVWRPYRQVAFGRRDVNEPGYERACEIASERGFEPVERQVGGRAVAYTGSTLAFARCHPIDDPRHGLGERYERLTSDVLDALTRLGVSPERGEPDDSFCPGAHSLRANGKLVGIAQRIRQETALVSGILVVRDHRRIAAVLDPIYDALDVDFDPESVGSVAEAGGPSDPDAVSRAIEQALIGAQPHTVRTLGPDSD